MHRFYAIDLRHIGDRQPYGQLADMIAAGGGVEKASMRERALSVLQNEHRSLLAVVALLERLLKDVATLDSEPDFVLLSSALYYIDEFPERVHHPKEERHIFDRLRRRTTALDPALDRLQSQHLESDMLASRAARALVRYQGGAPDGLSSLRAAVGAYSALLAEHIRAEDQLLDSAAGYLTDGDWLSIAAGFEAHVDPLSDHSTSQEFRRLHGRILNMLPRKMRVGGGAPRDGRAAEIRPGES
jgi:hemerythrin-like domain-containing protein